MRVCALDPSFHCINTKQSNHRTECAFLEVQIPRFRTLHRSTLHRTASSLFNHRSIIILLLLRHTHHCQFLEMAAQRPPPNWVAFSAASRRVSQSTNQLVQALQASANIPADIATMSSELEQLEHQPTNAALQQQFQQIQQQMTAL